MTFTIYKANGQISRIVNVVDIESQILEGESYIEGTYSDVCFYIENGTPKYIPECPGDYHYFDFDSKQWVIDQVALLINIKNTRKRLLTESDWTQLPDVPLATKQAWATYRQALRDITTQEGYPFNVIWPTKPQ